MKRVLVTLLAGASVFLTGAAHAACAGSRCVELNIKSVHREDVCDNTGSAGCCVYYTWAGQDHTLTCV